MAVRFTTGVAFAGALALSACGSPPDEQASGTSAPAATSAEPSAAATVAAADGRPAAFAQCAACHAVEPGKMGIGPSLAGVFGTKSGEIPGYAFSEAMKTANLTWDEATLDRYLTSPAKVVPGTRMTYASLADPAARKAIIEYLKALK